jgi:hypothetical protein
VMQMNQTHTTAAGPVALRLIARFRRKSIGSRNKRLAAHVNRARESYPSHVHST